MVLLKGPLQGGGFLQARYRGTSLTRKLTTLGPYPRPMPRVLGGSWGGGHFLLGEVALYSCTRFLGSQLCVCEREKHLKSLKAFGLKVGARNWTVQECLAHRKHPPSLGPPYGTRHSPTVGSQEWVVSY